MRRTEPYDVMQVCMNGHQITDHYIDRPHDRQDACRKCGADTIHECVECGETIRGKHDPPGSGRVGIYSATVPNYCKDCGAAYPWADNANEFSEVDSGVLDSELAEECLSTYENGDYQEAVRTAFIILEERVREKGEFEADDYGDSLMSEAFSVNGGPLSFGETGAEKQGAMFLYRGAIMALRNPASHRFVEEADQDYARDVLHTVNLLLRILEENTD
ncbi:TIGR02391 family protein [Halomicrococcus sp. NG-SE-24]|uniref:TIGR02391 family protein n=1 Tax=Halomicrococcus sp. NG-SE-24 TaxID=3436928 RepID=UPI003D97350B